MVQLVHFSYNFITLCFNLSLHSLFGFLMPIKNLQLLYTFSKNILVKWNVLHRYICIGLIMNNWFRNVLFPLIKYFSGKKTYRYGSGKKHSLLLHGYRLLKSDRFESKTERFSFAFINFSSWCIQYDVRSSYIPTPIDLILITLHSLHWLWRICYSCIYALHEIETIYLYICRHTEFSLTPFIISIYLLGRLYSHVGKCKH